MSVQPSGHEVCGRDDLHLASHELVQILPPEDPKCQQASRCHLLWLPLDVVVPLVEADAGDVVLVEEHLEEVRGGGLVTEDHHLPAHG